MEHSRRADSQEQACGLSGLSGVELDGAALALSLLSAAEACCDSRCMLSSVLADFFF